MKLAQDTIIFVAKILIFIGDVVIFIGSSIWRVINTLPREFQKNKNEIFKFSKTIKTKLKLPHRVVETEIYSTLPEKPKISLPSVNIPSLFKKPNFQRPNINFSRPKIELPKIQVPKFNIPRLKMPQIRISRPKLPSVALPKPSFPSLSISLPKLPRITINKPHLPSVKLPSFHIRHKTKRKRSIRSLPFTTRFKYIAIGTLFSFLFLFLPLVFVIFIQNLPNPHELAYQETAQTTKIYDRNKTLLYQIYANQNRTNIPLSNIPKNLQNATIAIEDNNFYRNPGFDILAIGRSAIADISGHPLQGGSTLTQQLIKARLLTPQRSIDRKIKEVILSVWAEKIYSKDQILEMYFNQVPYGGTAWGAEAAAQTYFGKKARELDLAQSAFLAGLPQAPSIYSPYADTNLWKNRQKEVLTQMVELKFITKGQEKAALSEKLKFQPLQHIIKAPHFVMYVKDLLVEKYGLATVERGGLNVITTLDLKTQDMAQKIITNEVDSGRYLNFTNGASLITNPSNGDILAMVGGKDYYDPEGGNYNVTTALRQPGSTIKVITYSAALMNGYTPATQIQDSPVSFLSPGSPPYSPVNYDGKYHGNVTLRNALGNSINIPAVKTLNQVGIKTVVDLSKSMGITTLKEPENYGLSLTLGSAEVKMTDMATAYGTLANGGKRVELNPILKITNYQGATLEEKKDIREKTVLPQEVAFIINNILADNQARALEFGLNSPLSIPGHTVSVKTGTTDQKRDNWTIGYTKNLLTAVWVGNNNNAPMNPVLASGITGAAPIWNKIMNNMLSRNNTKNEIYTPTANIVIRPCGGRNEYFIRGTEKLAPCRPISLNENKPN